MKIEWGSKEERNRKPLLLTTTPVSLSGIGRSAGRSWDVLQFEERVLLAPDGE